MNLLAKLKDDYPEINFTEGIVFCWSPKSSSVSYVSRLITSNTGTWTLLHELGHGLLGHTNYSSDIELVKMEAAAWQKAKKISADYNISIDEDHIQDCLDTYRDWLHQRSRCPECTNASLQIDPNTYKCSNCGQSWHVSNARFCRPYRQKIPEKINKS
jgi:hypothetical protein